MGDIKAIPFEILRGVDWKISRTSPPHILFFYADAPPPHILFIFFMNAPHTFLFLVSSPPPPEHFKWISPYIELSTRNFYTATI